MIGIYDYTVILTYCSLISAVAGIFTALHGNGHPYLGIFFLMFSGLCDAFDGKVARTKKNRTEKEKKFGIQIDSLSDLVAFGVLPACIGDSMLWTYNKFRGIPHLTAVGDLEGGFMYYVIVAVMILYVLNALIRLAYYNVTEELIQEEGGKHREYYEGLPVTNAALIFPLVMLFQYIFAADLTAVYFLVMFIVAVLFITPIKLPKLGLKGTLFMIGIGVVEALFLLFFHGGINIH